MPRRQLEMTAEQERALDQAEARLRKVEDKAARLVAEARAEVARAMLAAGASAVARRDGLTRQAIHLYIQRYGDPSRDFAAPRRSRREAFLELPAEEAVLRRNERERRRKMQEVESHVSSAAEQLKAARNALTRLMKT